MIKIIRLCYGIVKWFYYIVENINGYTTRAMSQSSRGARIVLLSKIFSRGVDSADVVGGARIFYGVDGATCMAYVDCVYPLWEHRIFDGGPFVKG